MREAICRISNKRGARGQHPGLLLQRYAKHPVVGKENGAMEERKQLLQDAIRAAQNVELRKLYVHAMERWKRSLPKLTETFELQTVGRLIVGLGSDNVLETGITLHHTYGMPVIPGSSLKGVAAHYCATVWGPADDRFSPPSAATEKEYEKYLAGERSNRPTQGQYYRLLFGSTLDRGCIVFHDAWYIPGSGEVLCRDVMTPHHVDFNRNPGDPKFRPPTDFDGPTPVSFLSVTGKFLFAVSWSGPQVGQAQDWVRLAAELLQRALRERGVGGKTSSGYGRFCRP